jgi:hypothetical protein
VRRFDTSAYAADDARGLTIDPRDGQIFILDAGGRKLLRLEGETRRRRPDIALPRGLPEVRGLAAHPISGHLHLYSTSARELYEVDRAGRLVALRSLPAAAPLELKAMTFAPSTDRTDDPARTNLCLVGTSGGGAFLTEWSLRAAPRQKPGPAAARPATVVKRIRVAKMSDPDVANFVQAIDGSADELLR